MDIEGLGILQDIDLPGTPIGTDLDVRQEGADILLDFVFGILFPGPDDNVRLIAALHLQTGQAGPAGLQQALPLLQIIALQGRGKSPGDQLLAGFLFPADDIGVGNAPGPERVLKMVFDGLLADDTAETIQGNSFLGSSPAAKAE